jgi:hypothetical protein
VLDERGHLVRSRLEPGLDVGSVVDHGEGER